MRGHHICHQHSAMELQHVAVGTVLLLILLSSGELLSLFNILNHMFLSEG